MPDPGRAATERVAAVVVDYDTPEELVGCVASLLAEGADVVVVENGRPEPARMALARAGVEVPVVAPGCNIGYGAGVNRGLAAAQPSEYLLACNSDLTVHPGSLGHLVAALDREPAWAICGPQIVNTDRTIYPSVRRFPSMVDAAGHALLALFKPDNRFSRRYRPPTGGGDHPRTADWVSGACFLARRTAFEELGGFDESYFMFAEDMDLCWRAHRAGWLVGFEPSAEVTHTEGVSRRRHPYRMLIAHHRSALRFAARTTDGWRRAALPLAAAVLGVRLAISLADQALHRLRPAPRKTI